MIKVLLAVCLSFFPLINVMAQEYKIKGRVVLGQEKYPASGVYVGFNTTPKVETSPDGRFEITANQQQISDTLTIYLLSYNKISIINFPGNPVVDLGAIPIYEYAYGVPTVHFDCGTADLACKRKQKRFWQKYEKERKSYLKKMDAIIGNYRLSLNGELYSINPDNHVLDLSKPVEE